MTRVKDREKAIALRKQGKSYSEIREEIVVNKSTLSNWLKDYPLSKEHVDLLRTKSYLRIERFRQTMLLKRNVRLKSVYEEQKSKLLPLSDRELFVAGLFLYWGEGNKSLKNSLSINNTDPQVVKFALCWMIKSLKIPKEKIKVYLHLYSDMNVKIEVNFWAKLLGLPLSQFNKPYVKVSSRVDLTQKGFGHGTCGVVTNDVRLKEKIIMSISSIADYYGDLSDIG